MGRYYNGDIEGKFWFGVQPSNDADFFGVEGTEPNYLEYYYTSDDIEGIEKGIATCLKTLGDNKEKFDEFFEKNNGYNDQMLDEAGLNKDLLEWYARLDLGEKIYNKVKETGECVFQAEI
jgi:hypothetical protein